MRRSGYGRSGRKWKTRPNPGSGAAGHAEDEQHAEDMRKRAELLAPALGFCTYCAGDIDEANGKLHHPECVVADARKCFHEWEAELVYRDNQAAPVGRATPICRKCGRRKTT